MDLYDETDETSTRPRRPRHATRVDDAVARDIQRRMATVLVRRKCNQSDHRCTAPSTGRCTHPNHRRDADLLLSTDERHPGMLDMLGLDTTYAQYTEGERMTLLKWIGQSGPAESPE